jgi:hypothetical protein
MSGISSVSRFSEFNNRATTHCSALLYEDENLMFAVVVAQQRAYTVPLFVVAMHCAEPGRAGDTVHAMSGAEQQGA